MASRSPRIAACSLQIGKYLAKTVAQLALIAPVFCGDENGVVAGNRADHLRPAGAVDGHRHALRRARRGPDDRERRAGRAHVGDECRDRVERIVQHLLRGRNVTVSRLGDAELAQIAADARLSGFEPLLAQDFHQLVLIVHGRLPQDAENRGPARYGLVDFCGH
jgi:hypothetical protein